MRAVMAEAGGETLQACRPSIDGRRDRTGSAWLGGLVGRKGYCARGRRGCFGECLEANYGRLSI